KKPRRVSPPQRRKALELFLGRLCRPQKHISDRKCARRARAAGCNLLGRKRPAGLFWPEKNAPDFFKSGAWNVAHAVPPWFSRRSPERPSKPPTRPRPLTRPTVPPYLLFRRTAQGPVIHRAATHRFAPTTGSLKGACPVFFPVAAFDVLHFNEGTAVCQVDFSEGAGIRCTSIWG